MREKGGRSMCCGCGLPDLEWYEPDQTDILSLAVTAFQHFSCTCVLYVLCVVTKWQL